MFVVDTNVLVYAVDSSHPRHSDYRLLLAEWRGQRIPWFVTWSIIYEFLRVTTHAKVMRRPWSTDQAMGFINALLESPSLRVLVEMDGHAAVASQTIEEMPALRGSRMHDAHIAALMREHGIRTIYTRDRGFQDFGFLEAVDPIVRG